MTTARQGVASSVLNGKLYAIGGQVYQVLKFMIHLQKLGRWQMLCLAK